MWIVSRVRFGFGHKFFYRLVSAVAQKQGHDERNGDLKSTGNSENGRRRQQETAERREHRLALRRQRRQQETEEQSNKRLEYQREYQGRRRLNFNTQSNAGPLSNENPQQREHRLERVRQNFATRIQNETEEER